MAGTRGSRPALAAGLAFAAAGIGLTTLWFALDTRSRDGLEAVLVPPLLLGVAFAAGWACLLGIALLLHRSWARWWALFTFGVVGAFSGWAFFDTARRVVVDSGTAPVRHLVAPASLLTVATSIVLLLVFPGEPDPP